MKRPSNGGTTPASSHGGAAAAAVSKLDLNDSWTPDATPGAEVAGMLGEGAGGGGGGGGGGGAFAENGSGAAAGSGGGSASAGSAVPEMPAMRSTIGGCEPWAAK